MNSGKAGKSEKEVLIQKIEPFRSPFRMLYNKPTY